MYEKLIHSCNIIKMPVSSTYLFAKLPNGNVQYYVFDSMTPKGAKILKIGKSHIHRRLTRISCYHITNLCRLKIMAISDTIKILVQLLNIQKIINYTCLL